jgi:hypothetical protein
VFLAHFVREIVSNNGLIVQLQLQQQQAAAAMPQAQAEEAALLGLRPLAERLLFARLHAHVFVGVDAVPLPGRPAIDKKLPVPAASAAVAATRLASSTVVSPSMDVSGPLVPVGSAADVMARRDRIWLRKQPLVARMTAEEVGVPLHFLGALPSERGSVGGSAGGGGGGGGGPPFAVASALLARIDGLVLPTEMVTHLVAAIDAAIAEAMARAAASLSRDAATGLPRQRRAAPNVTAEDLVPLLIFCCSRSRWLRPHAALAFVGLYGTGAGTGFSSGGKESYLITVVSSAIAWICQRKALALASPPQVQAALAARRRAATGEEAAALMLQVAPAPAPPPEDERADEADYADFARRLSLRDARASAAAGLAADGALADGGGDGAVAEQLDEADEDVDDDDDGEEEDYAALMESCVEDLFEGAHAAGLPRASTAAERGLRSALKEQATIEGALSHFV